MAGSRCYIFSHTDLALMCQIKHVSPLGFLIFFCLITPSGFLVYLKSIFSDYLYFAVAVFSSFFFFFSPDFSENDLIKNTKLLFLKMVP